MRELICAELQRIAARENVTILYACESGSRAWGFESRDSDYDVRFLYLRPTARYLTIGSERDVIEYPINDALDISGWDIKKALALFHRSNAPLLEWLQSPVVYAQSGLLAEKMRTLMTTYASPIACLHHYLSMARKEWEAFASEDGVRAKKLLYRLRAALASAWIANGLGVAPIAFQTLVNTLVTEPALLREIGELVAIKQAGIESDCVPRSRTITALIEQQTAFADAHMARLIDTGWRSPGMAALDQLFFETIVEANGVALLPG